MRSLGQRNGSQSATCPRADEFELLIDCEEDRRLRAVLVGMLREADETRVAEIELWRP
jgi:hypothetical protein